MAKRTVFLMLSCILVVHTVHGLRCFKCESSETENCHNYGLSEQCLYAHSHSQDQTYGTACVKITAEGRAGEFVARSCTPAGFGNMSTGCAGLVHTLNLFQGMEGGANRLVCDFCYEEFCNSASKYAGLGFVSFSLAATVLML